MKEKKNIIIDCVDSYNKILNVETRHPLVTVVDIKQNPQWVNGTTFHYHLYALFLKHGEGCSIRYGREKYDYQQGTIVTFAPGQSVEVFWNKDLPMPASRGLLFHPDLIYGTPLGKKISDYTFFAYSQREALHVAEREQKTVEALLDQISSELEHPVDQHTQTLITDSISLLLDYCMRYYDRQFITRHKVCSDVLAAFERNLNLYFEHGAPAQGGLPTVAYFADKACLSTGYFGDLIKRETGITAQSHIQQAIINRSKQLIKASDQPISNIAYELGFQYVQHFTRLFKNKVGMTPVQFRNKAI